MDTLLRVVTPSSDACEIIFYIVVGFVPSVLLLFMLMLTRRLRRIGWVVIEGRYLLWVCGLLVVVGVAVVGIIAGFSAYHIFATSFIRTWPWAMWLECTTFS